MTTVIAPHLLPLRGYQGDTLARVAAAWGRGVRRPAAVLPTGTGKTVIFAHLIEQWETRIARELGAPGRVIVLAHRDELVRQAAGKIHSVAPHLSIGVVKAGENETGADVIVASVQTLRSESRRRQITGVGLVIVDECFPAGTLVGGRPIESLRPGDLVPSWDEVTGGESLAPVTRVMRRVPAGMVRVRLVDGTSFECTPNHPILTARGWCPAARLNGEVVISFTHDATASGNVHEVRESRTANREIEDRYLSPVGPDVLLRRLPGRVGQGEFVRTDGQDEQAVRVRAHAGPEPHGASGSAGKDGRYVAGDWAQTAFSRGQWNAATGAGTPPRGVFGVAGECDRGPTGRGAAISLQAGYSAPHDDGVRRSGRGIPLLAESPRIRPAPGRTALGTRVADVQILERGRDGTYGGVCPDGAVYNLEVAGTHTYLVGTAGVVAHNCHHATANTYLDVLDHYGTFGQGAYAAGFTATMERSDGVALGQVWEEVVFEYPILEAIRRGYLCDPVGYAVKVPDMDMSKVRTTAGDFRESDLGEAITESSAPAVAVEKYLQHGQGQQGLTFTPTVDTAHLMAEVYNEAGIKTAAVDGATPPAERAAIVGAYRAGELDMLTNCMIFTEGTDLPTAAVGVLMRPTQSRSLYVQMAGRVLRPDPARPGKVATLIDISGAAARHNLVGRATLLGSDVEAVAEDGASLTDIELAIAEAEEAKRAGSAPPAELKVAEQDDEVLDLFHGQRLTWTRTPAGLPFLTLGDRLVCVMPAAEPGKWDVAWYWQLTPPGEARGGWVERGIDDVGYALAWAESMAPEWGHGFSRRKAPWRAKKIMSGRSGDLFTPRSRSPLAHEAARLGITWEGTITAGELSDRIDERKYGQMLDQLTLPYLRKIGVTP